MRSTLRTILAAAVLAPCGLAAAQAQAPVNVGDVNARVRALEDREAIRTLWAEYGRTLDARDFTAFAGLFARDAEFVGGPGSPAKGPAAIGTFLEKAIGTNYPNSKGRNFHLYFNETIDLRGDEGSAVSKGGFLMTNAENAKADVLLLATYRDQFVREDGRWKFKRREVIGEIPVPRAAVPTQAGQAVAADVVGVGNFSHIVSNFDRSLEFYRDVLGLEVTVSQPFSPNPAIMALGNTPGAQSRFTALRVPGSGIGVELIEYKDIDRRPQSPRFHDPGAANLALQVRDLSAILPRLRKFGARIITDGGTPAAIGNGLYLFVQDPDGFVVELAQGTPPADSKVPASNNIYGGQFELTVADSAASVKFYNELLGFDMRLGESFNDNQLMARTAGAPGASFRQSRSMIPGTSVPMTLIEFKNIDRRPLTGRVQDPGTAILQLRVRDVTTLTARLKAAGVPVVTAGGVPVEVRPGLKISIVRDPNNLMLELLQAQ